MEERGQSLTVKLSFLVNWILPKKGELDFSSKLNLNPVYLSRQNQFYKKIQFKLPLNCECRPKLHTKVAQSKVAHSSSNVTHSGANVTHRNDQCYTKFRSKLHIFPTKVAHRAKVAHRTQCTK